MAAHQVFPALLPPTADAADVCVESSLIVGETWRAKTRYRKDLEGKDSASRVASLAADR